MQYTIVYSEDGFAIAPASVTLIEYDTIEETIFFLRNVTGLWRENCTEEEMWVRLKVEHVVRGNITELIQSILGYRVISHDWAKEGF